MDLTRKLMSAFKKKKKSYVITKGDIYKVLNGGLDTVMSLIIKPLRINFITTIMQMKRLRLRPSKWSKVTPFLSVRTGPGIKPRAICFEAQALDYNTKLLSIRYLHIDEN